MSIPKATTTSVPATRLFLGSKPLQSKWAEKQQLFDTNGNLATLRILLQDGHFWMPWAIGIDGGKVGVRPFLMTMCTWTGIQPDPFLQNYISLCQYQFLRQILFAHFFLFVCRGQDVFFFFGLTPGMLCWWPEWLQWWILPCTCKWQGYLEYFSFDCKCCHLACSYLPQICKIVVPEHPYLNSSYCPLKKEDEKGHIYNRTCIDAFIRFWFHDIPCSS